MLRRRVCFVTGTRAEFGLMERTLRQLRDHPAIDFRLVVTGMHLSRAHGRTIDTIRRQGWTIDATVPWHGPPAVATGAAIAGLARAFDRIEPDVVLVVGDRVEAFAAATAAHLGGRIVAHVHGGDRAEGQSDDCLRHAISKLSHVHFAATKASGRRLLRLGEDAFRVHVVGTPGLDGIVEAAADSRRELPPSPFALVLLHPDGGDDDRQARQAKRLVTAMRRAAIDTVRVVLPNNDPGWAGIARTWQGVRRDGWGVEADVPRDDFLRLLRHAAILIGNSSSGIIEAASLGTRVVNVGDRQRGRERSANVTDVDWDPDRLNAAVAMAWSVDEARRFAGRNVYGIGDAAPQITSVLAALDLGPRTRRKLISY